MTTERGRIDLTRTDDLDTVVPDWKGRAAYVCGPPEMLDAATALWQSSRTCPTRLERRTVRAGAARAVPGGEGGLVTFETSDREVEADGSTPLLEAGEDAGVVMPSGCRMGICQSCLIPLLAGQVRDLRTGEVHGEQGQLIQTCISAAAGPVHLEI